MFLASLNKYRQTRKYKENYFPPHTLLYLKITSSKGGSIWARITVAVLRALSGALTLIMPLAVCAIAKTDPESFPAAACFGTIAPITPVAPAICRNKHRRKDEREHKSKEQTGNNRLENLSEVRMDFGKVKQQESVVKSKQASRYTMVQALGLNQVRTGQRN